MKLICKGLIAVFMTRLPFQVELVEHKLQDFVYVLSILSLGLNWVLLLLLVFLLLGALFLVFRILLLLGCLDLLLLPLFVLLAVLGDFDLPAQEVQLLPISQQNRVAIQINQRLVAEQGIAFELDNLLGLETVGVDDLDAVGLPY